jgi:hypothetical protein
MHTLNAFSSLSTDNMQTKIQVLLMSVYVKIWTAYSSDDVPNVHLDIIINWFQLVKECV